MSDDLTQYEDPNATHSAPEPDATTEEAAAPKPPPPPVIDGWKLDTKFFKKTIFEKRKMKEYPNIKQINGFIVNEMGVSTIQPNWEYKSELEHMKKYRTMWDKNEEYVKAEIKLPKHKWGRAYPIKALSLCMMCRNTRHTLAQDRYIDIDMENCQPQIFSEICKKEGVAVPSLDAYCEDKKGMRENIMEHHDCSKDVAKQLTIALLFGGTYKAWIIRNDIEKNERKPLKLFNKLEQELGHVAAIVYASNPQISKDVLRHDKYKWHDLPEKKRGVMALWAQSIERVIQETAILYLNKKKEFAIADIIPSQDGFMILKEKWYDGLTDDLTAAVSEKYGITIEWSRKPFDEAYEIPEDDVMDNPIDWFNAFSQKQLADTFLKHWGHLVCTGNGGTLYTYAKDKWHDETDKDRRYKLYTYISEDLYEMLWRDFKPNMALMTDAQAAGLAKRLRENTSRSSSVNDIIKHIIPKAEDKGDLFNADAFLLGFNNGVFDLQTMEFRAYEYSDYMTISTGYDYIPFDKNNAEMVKKKDELNAIIEGFMPEPELRRLYLQILASGLDGRAYQKLFLFNGAGGNGKGLTGSFMDKILGAYYHQPSNGILKDVEKANVPSPDMYNLMHKRYTNFKEVSGAVRVSVLRNLTGGGKFCGRLLNHNPVHFLMTSTFVMEFNNAPELDGKPQEAEERRLMDIGFPVNFTDKKDKIGKVIGGVLWLEANTYYETPEFLDAMRDAWLSILLDAYNDARQGMKGIVFDIPDSVRARTDKFIANQNIFLKIFNDQWRVVEIENPKDKEEIESKTQKLKYMWGRVQDDEFYRKLTSRERREYSRDEYYKWCEQKFRVQGNRKVGKYVVGLMWADGEGNDGEISDDDGIEEDENTIIGKW